jgi:hypothetical protein
MASAEVKSSIPPPTWKLANEMPKNDRICRPSSALTPITMNTVTDAIHTVRRRCPGPKSCVKWMKNGTQASGLTMANSVIRGLRSMNLF